MPCRRRRRLIAAAVAAIALLAIAAPAARAETRPPRSREEVRFSFAAVVARAAPAVVNIYSRRIVQSRGSSPLFDDPFFRRFFGGDGGQGMPRQRVQNSLGSGVVVDARGIIVTNHHVVAGADEIICVLSDRREMEAALVGSDERTDLAVLKVDLGDERLANLEFRDSDQLEVGDLVLAIGNPFGVGQTVTSGIVSALAQTRVGISDLNFFIQTDAAINPGNSGGALIDVDGQLIGINTAIYSRSGGSLGIGFAVPSNMVRTVVQGFAGAGRVVRAWLGAWGRTVTADLAQGLGLKAPGGVVIEEVYPGGPADRAGIRIGDVVVAVQGRAVADSAALDYRIATLPAGESREMDLVRRGRPLTLPIRAEEPPEQPPRELTLLEGAHPLAGATVANLSPALAEELGEGRAWTGVVVADVRAGTPAQRIGLKRGDRLVSLNGAEIASAAGLRRQAERSRPPWQLRIRRGPETFDVVIRG